MGARILVTGAGGFVGAAVCQGGPRRGARRHCARPQRQVAARGRRKPGVAAPRRSCRMGRRLPRFLARSKPDIVIHSAWEGVGGALRGGDIQLENIRTTVALRRCCDCRGSAQVRRHRLAGRIWPLRPQDRGKRSSAAHHALRGREAGGEPPRRAALPRGRREFAWLRLFSVYGPGDNRELADPFHRGFVGSKARAPKCTAGTQKWDYLHIDDVARRCACAATTKNAKGVFNLSSGNPVAVRRIVEMLRDLAAPGTEPGVRHIPFGPDQIMHLEGDNERLRGATGWSVRVPIGEGLRQVVEEMRVAA